METRIEHIKFSNNPTGKAETSAHKQIIEQNTKNGFHYCGFVPVKIGPSGKLLSIDMIFQK